MPSWAGQLAFLLGATILGAWAAGVHDGLFALPSASTALLLLAASLGVISAGCGRRSAQLGFGALTLIAALGGGAAFLAVGHAYDGNGGGWPSLPSAFVFACAGLSLLLTGRRTDPVGYVAALLAGAGTMVGISGFALDLPLDSWLLRGLSPVGLVGITLIVAGLLALRPGLPPFASIAGHTSAARLARRLALAIVLVPVGAAGIYAHVDLPKGILGVGGALTLAIVVVALSAATGISVRRIDRAERERDAARELALAKEREFRAMATELPIGLFRCDGDHEFLYFNPFLAGLLGIIPGDLAGAAPALLERLHPDDRVAITTPDAAGRTIQDHFLTDAMEMECRIVDPEGTPRHIQITTTPLIDDTGRTYQGTVTDVTERRLAETVLRHSERRFRDLAVQMPAGVIRRDRTGALTFINDEAHEILGSESSVGLTQMSLDIFHPDDRERASAAAASLIEHGSALEMELRAVRPDGEVRWLMIRSTRQLDDQGEYAGILSTFVDVTDRRVSQDALRRSEELHRLTVANLPGAVVGLYDRDLRCLLMEGQGGQAMQLTNARCQGKRLAEFSTQQVADDLEPAMRRALEGEEIEMEYVSVGSSSVLQFQIVPFRSAGGAIDGVVIISADVTEQREAEAAQRSAIEQLRVAFDHAPIGIALVGLDGRLTRVNDALSDITGHSADELLTHSQHQLVHPGDLAAVDARAAEIGVKSDSTAIECRLLHADGHVVWIDARTTLIRDDDGRPIHALLQAQDITDRRRYEHELQHLADHDPLTGLLNRRGFEGRLQGQMDYVRACGNRGALLMIDLDGFKNVNDTFGHAAGDEVIVQVGRAITGRLRDTDTVSRLGGDEFAVILPDATHDEAVLVAQSLVEAIRAGASTAQHRAGRVTASIGVVDCDAELSAAELMVHGDRAMYQAKEAGKNQIRWVATTS